MSTMQLTVPEEYPWVLLMVVFTCVHYQMQGIAIGGLRRKFFSEKFFAEHFPALKGDYPKGGYPDTGHGRFSDALPLEQWMQFGNAQRAHLNYLEFLPPALVVELVAGLFYPRLTLATAFLFMVGRQLFSWGYRAKGPNGRIVGVAIADLSVVILLIASVVGLFNAGGGMAGLTKVIASLCKF